jgi:hypothetical protein
LFTGRRTGRQYRFGYFGNSDSSETGNKGEQTI